MSNIANSDKFQTSLVNNFSYVLEGVDLHTNLFNFLLTYDDFQEAISDRTQIEIIKISSFNGYRDGVFVSLQNKSLAKYIEEFLEQNYSGYLDQWDDLVNESLNVEAEVQDMIIDYELLKKTNLTPLMIIAVVEEVLGNVLKLNL